MIIEALSLSLIIAINGYILSRIESLNNKVADISVKTEVLISKVGRRRRGEI